MISSDSSLEAEFTFERDRGREVDDPPFRMLVLGDWSGDADKAGFSERRPIEIDRDNFDDIVKRVAPHLTLEKGDGRTLSLDFQTLDDFHPDQIFRRLPMFERLRQLRRDLLSPEGFNSAAAEIRSWFNIDRPSVGSQPVESDVGTSDGLLDAILAGSNAPASAIKRSNDPELSALVRDLVRPHLVSVDENERSALLTALDAATSDLMRHVLHDRGFQALEAAWRGLYFLVRRVETDSDLRIYILDVSKDELARDLQQVADLSDSRLYELIVRDAVETPGGEPWAVVAGNFAFQPDKDDVAALIRIAKISAAADAPFVSHIRPQVLNVDSLFGHTDPGEWDLSGMTGTGKLWNVLRGIPESVYLGMTIPRLLARLPYGRETEPLETFQFEEFEAPPAHDDYLWTNGCFVAAVLMGQTFSEFGWSMDRRFLQDIDHLPLYMYQADGETVYQPCGEALLSQNACERLMEFGLMPLASYKNTDRIKLTRFQSISDPVKGLRGRWTGR